MKHGRGGRRPRQRRRKATRQSTRLQADRWARKFDRILRSWSKEDWGLCLRGAYQLEGTS